VNIFMFDEDGQDLGLETRLQDVTFLSLWSRLSDLMVCYLVCVTITKLWPPSFFCLFWFSLCVFGVSVQSHRYVSKRLKWIYWIQVGSCGTPKEDIWIVGGPNLYHLCWPLYARRLDASYTGAS
jgi:hypothetical protein